MGDLGQTRFNMKDLRQRDKVPGCGYIITGLHGAAVPPPKPYICRDRSLPLARVNLTSSKKGFLSCIRTAMKTGLGTRWAYYLDTWERNGITDYSPNHATMGDVVSGQLPMQVDIYNCIDLVYSYRLVPCINNRTTTNVRTS